MAEKIFKVIIGLLFFGAFLIAGLWAGYNVVNQLPLALTSKNWPMTEGTISYAHLRVRGKESKNRFSLKYEYQIDKHYYTNNQIYFMSRVFGRSARENADLYTLGKTVTVYYHPDKPGISVLENRVNWLGFTGAFLIFIIFSLIGLLGLRTTFKFSDEKK